MILCLPCSGIKIVFENETQKKELQKMGPNSSGYNTVLAKKWRVTSVITRTANLRRAHLITSDE